MNHGGGRAREDSLAELRQGIGGIDPVLDAASNYGRAIKEAQLTIREQGVVMRQTLKNNFNLYHTNRKLTGEARDLRLETAQANRERDMALERERVLLERLKIIENSEGGYWKLAFESLRKTFDQYMHDNLTHDELKELLAKQEEQAKEIAAMPDLVTPEELAESGAAPYPTANGLPPRTTDPE